MKARPKKIIIRRRGGAVPLRTSDAADEPESCGCLCFLLGASLGPIGILVAAIIAKTPGVVAAVWGFVATTVLFLAVYGIGLAVGIRLV